MEEVIKSYCERFITRYSFTYIPSNKNILNARLVISIEYFETEDIEGYLSFLFYGNIDKEFSEILNKLCSDGYHTKSCDRREIFEINGKLNKTEIIIVYEKLT